MISVTQEMTLRIVSQSVAAAVFMYAAYKVVKWLRATKALAHVVGVIFSMGLISLIAMLVAGVPDLGIPSLITMASGAEGAVQQWAGLIAMVVGSVVFVVCLSAMVSSIFQGFSQVRDGLRRRKEAISKKQEAKKQAAERIAEEQEEVRKQGSKEVKKQEQDVRVERDDLGRVKRITRERMEKVASERTRTTVISIVSVKAILAAGGLILTGMAGAAIWRREFVNWSLEKIGSSIARGGDYSLLGYTLAFGIICAVGLILAFTFVRSFFQTTAAKKNEVGNTGGVKRPKDITEIIADEKEDGCKAFLALKAASEHEAAAELLAAPEDVREKKAALIDLKRKTGKLSRLLEKATALSEDFSNQYGLAYTGGEIDLRNLHNALKNIYRLLEETRAGPACSNYTENAAVLDTAIREAGAYLASEVEKTDEIDVIEIEEALSIVDEKILEISASHIQQVGTGQTQRVETLHAFLEALQEAKVYLEHYTGADLNGKRYIGGMNLGSVTDHVTALRQAREGLVNKLKPSEDDTDLKEAVTKFREAHMALKGAEKHNLIQALRELGEAIAVMNWRRKQQMFL